MTEYQVTYQGIVHDQQGYARASREYLLGLDRAGVDIRVEPLNFGTPSASLEMDVVNRLKELIAKPRNLSKKQVLIYHAQPYGIDAREERDTHGYDKVIINTVWETTIVPDNWFPYVNYADAIVVPSTQNVEALRNSGVTVPIFKVNHGSDLVRFAPDNEPIDSIDLKGMENTFKFLSVFQWQHRKAPDLLLRAFWNEFTDKDDVALIIKTHIGGQSSKQQQRELINTVHRYKNMVGKQNTAPVLLSTSLFNDNDLRGLYTLSDVYVQPSRGEGVGLPFIEAMSSGIPCIATGWGGQTDFVTNDNGYLLDYKLESPRTSEGKAIANTFSSLFTNDMKWAEADVEHLQKLMRHAYEHKEEVKAKGSLARFDMAGMTWNEVGNIFKKSIEKVLCDNMELNQYERQYYSQNGEDGIIQEICNRIPLSSNFFVEFGVEDGLQCNCRYLYEKFWQGLMIEGSPEMYERLKYNYDQNAVKTVHSFITKENIVQLFEENNVPKDLGLLSVDIDGNDYWVLKEILLADYRPSIIVAEYNAFYTHSEEWIMKYNPEHLWDGTSYQGVSLQSLTKLCNKFDYALVATDTKGVNAFYVRRDLLGSNLKELTPIEAYHPARYFGHMNDGQYGHPFKDGEFVKE